MSGQRKTLKLVVRNGGEINSIYDDDLIGLFVDAASVKIARASHVEPSRNGWYADMSPVGGPKLEGFLSRQQALDAEREWINQHVIGKA